MKLPFSFSLKIVFRLLVPGMIISMGFSPVLQTILDVVGAGQWNTIAFIFMIILFGWAIIISDMPIYMIFEGRRYWPKWVWKISKQWEEKRLERLQKAYKKALKEGNEEKYIELSVERRKFPINELGEYYAACPTRFGNLILSYEDYPNRIYGMDSPFYWPRIWLLLEKDLRDEVDESQALTDSAIYSTVALYVCGLLCLIYYILQLLNVKWIDYLPKKEILFGLFVGCIGIGYSIYRISLHLFAQFGEIFKSVFDIHHKLVSFDDILVKIAEISRKPNLVNFTAKQKNKIIWRYLHNYRIKLEETGESFTPQQLEENQD